LHYIGAVHLRLIAMKAQEKSGLTRQPEAFLKPAFLAEPLGIFNATDIRKRLETA
jgi:hypothetical protein